MPKHHPKGPAHVLYKTSRWTHRTRGLRARCLKRDEYRCALCLRTEASHRLVAHHRVPHRGNEELFFDLNNLQTLCQPCHDSITTSRERRGYSLELDENGLPTDERHPFCR